MKYISVGDMAQTYLLRNHNAQIKKTMTTLSEELVTGYSKDVGSAVGGDFTALAAISHSLQRTESYKQVASELDLTAGTQQATLATIQSHAEAIGSGLVAAGTNATATMVDATAQDTSLRFAAILEALNVSVSGRYVMAGIATDTRPVGELDDIMTALAAEVSGLTLVDDIVNAVDAWFDQPAGGGGFIDTAYFGSETVMAPIHISETDTAQLSLTAVDPSIRDLLKGFALATLVANDQVPSAISTRSALTERAGTQILSANAELTAVRSEVGTVESMIAEAQTRNAAEKTSLELAKTELIGVDSYESATALEAVQTQLETLYTLTSRLTQLTLTDYIR